MSEDRNTGLFVTELVSMLKDKLEEQVETCLHSSCHYVSLKHYRMYKMSVCESRIYRHTCYGYTVYKSEKIGMIIHD